MKYVVSPSLFTTDPESDIYQNTQTGERFSLTPETVRLLGLFKKPVTISSAMSKLVCRAKEKSAIELFLGRLIVSEVLVPESRLSGARRSPVNLADKAIVQAPKKTFFSCPYRDIKDLGQEDIVFVGMPCDLGVTGFPGTRFGPDRTRELSADTHEYHADIFTGKSRGWYSVNYSRTILGNIAMADIGNIIIQIGENIEKFYRRGERAARAILNRGGLPVMLGGDHSCSYPLIKAAHSCYGKVGLIQIDAHTDLAQLPKGISHNHGNVLTRVLDERLIHRLYQFGIRGLIGKANRRANCRSFSTATLVERGPKVVLPALRSDMPYYLTLDIDVLDPSYAPGTGTPVPEGMTPQVLVELIKLITSRVEIVGVDIVEVNPMLDRNNQTADLAINMLTHLLTGILQ